MLPFLAQEHQQQVATAVERAKQVTMTELNAIIGVSYSIFYYYQLLYSLLRLRYYYDYSYYFSSVKRWWE